MSITKSKPLQKWHENSMQSKLPSSVCLIKSSLSAKQSVMLVNTQVRFVPSKLIFKFLILNFGNDNSLREIIYRWTSNILQIPCANIYEFRKTKLLKDAKLMWSKVVATTGKTERQNGKPARCFLPLESPWPSHIAP